MRVVLDCMVFAQALIKPVGNAGRCIILAGERRYQLVVSDYVLGEIRELPQKLPPRLSVTPAKVEQLIAVILKVAEYVPEPPHTFDHPVDAADSAYVDLAVFMNATLIVTRDRHLLSLIDPTITWSAEFRARFPELSIRTVEQFLSDFT